jgi:hypothetical protein
VAIAEPHFKVFPEFSTASYARRYELLLRKLTHEKLYDAATFLTSTENGGVRGDFAEPAEDLTMKRLLASFAGHVAGYLAAIK